uniref:NADH dehydrogenase subunit 1 n=1 Tax=Chelophyes appendiculata TaxID=316211 RepID=UPI0026E16F43|nr:NADH dehydrogenase subunit 1 [Chelophyes appendiculata]WJJ69902.1 NADH dehydrogenase subunit 1 [Chelophyes appendiculata]
MTLIVNFLWYLFSSLIVIVPILIGVAYLTLLERKLLGYAQLRKGPNVVGLYGILQPLADGVKLFSKEVVIPSHANVAFFILAPILALVMGLIPWFIFPWGGVRFSSLIAHPYSLLLVLAVLSIGIFGVLLSGWSSSSKYAFLGAIRAVAQMISYEVSLTLILMSVIVLTGSLSLAYIHIIQNFLGWLLFPLWPVALIYFVSMLAETNRAPFDLCEGESELVSGYNVEYSSMPFAMFFLAEYSHIIFASFIFAILFMGGSLQVYPFRVLSYLLFVGSTCFKGVCICILFVLMRASYPRLRYDQVMMLMWKQYLPLSIGLVMFISALTMLLVSANPSCIF